MAAARSYRQRLHSLPPQLRYMRRLANDGALLGWTAKDMLCPLWTKIRRTTLVWNHVIQASQDDAFHLHHMPNDRQGPCSERAAVHSGALPKKSSRPDHLPYLGDCRASNLSRSTIDEIHYQKTGERRQLVLSFTFATLQLHLHLHTISLYFSFCRGYISASDFGQHLHVRKKETR